MKKIFAVLFVLTLSGCGTFSTTLSSDTEARRKLIKAETYCDEIPRIYSGVSFDVCLFHSEPSTKNPDVISTRARDSFVPLAAFDLLLCTVADTVLLPYSIYEQTTKGNLKIEQ